MGVISKGYANELVTEVLGKERATNKNVFFEKNT